MRTALLLGLLALGTSVSAQCKKETDDMTKKTTVKTETTQLGGTGGKGFTTPMYLKSKMVADETSIRLYLFPQFSEVHTIHEGSDVIFKFDDDSVITLKVQNTNTADFSRGMSFTQGSDNYIWTNTVRLEPTGEELTALKTKRIVKIRCYITDYSLKGDKQTLISQWLKCLESTK